jgi:WD40 repeat protein
MNSGSTMSRAARVVLLMVLFPPAATGTYAAPADRQAIASAYQRMDAAARQKKIADALTAFAADWAGTAKSPKLQLYPVQPDERVTAALLYKQATRVGAFTKITGFTPQSGGIVVRVALHLVATQESPSSPDSIELTSDVTRDDTWEKRGGKWTIARSYTSKGVMQQVFFVVHTTPDQTNEEEAPAWPRVLKGYQGDIVGLAFTPDGTTLVAVCKDKAIRLWDVSTGRLKETRQVQAGEPTAMALSPDGSLLAVGSIQRPTPRTTDSCVTLWDIKTARAIRTIPQGHCYLKAIAFSPDGKELCGGCDLPLGHNYIPTGGLLVQWDLDTGRQIRATKTKWDGTSHVLYRPGDPSEIASSADVGPTLWNAKTGAKIGVVLGLGHAIALSSDGRMIAVGGRHLDPDKDEDVSPFSGGYGHGEVELFDADTRKSLKTLTWPDEEGEVDSVAFSPDGKAVAAATGLAIVIWNVETGALVKHMAGEYGHALVYSPDGKLITSQDAAGHVTLEPAE